MIGRELRNALGTAGENESYQIGYISWNAKARRCRTTYAHQNGKPEAVQPQIIAESECCSREVVLVPKELVILDYSSKHIEKWLAA